MHLLFCDRGMEVEINKVCPLRDEAEPRAARYSIS